MTDTESLAARAKDELARLVAFDTTSRGSNLELIKYAEEKLGALGARLKRVPNADGTKSNLWGMIGPDVEGGVVLSGHTDVVPVDGQPWTSDPWTLTDKGDGRLYGRGTCDMKGFIALALAAAPDFARETLSRPVHFDRLELSITPSIGVAIYPRHALQFAKLYKAADQALYQVKGSGRASYALAGEDAGNGDFWLETLKTSDRLV